MITLWLAYVLQPLSSKVLNVVNRAIYVFTLGF